MHDILTIFILTIIEEALIVYQSFFKNLFFSLIVNEK